MARGSADRLAHTVSIAYAPPVTVLPLAALAAWHGTDDRAVVTSLFVYGSYLAGSITSPDLPRRSERLQPAVFATRCAAGAYPLLRYVDAAPLFLSVDAAVTLQLALLAIITIWWKISYHAASAAGLVVFALALGDSTLALPLTAGAIVVGWVRVRLNRHTPTQVPVVRRGRHDRRLARHRVPSAGPR